MYLVRSRVLVAKDCSLAAIQSHNVALHSPSNSSDCISYSQSTIVADNWTGRLLRMLAGQKYDSGVMQWNVAWRHILESGMRTSIGSSRSERCSHLLAFASNLGCVYSGMGANPLKIRLLTSLHTRLIGRVFHSTSSSIYLYLRC